MSCGTRRPQLRPGERSQDAARVIERQPRIARMQAGRIPVAQIDQEVRLPPAVREKLFVDLGSVESADRSAVETQRASGEQHVAALQR